MPIEIPYDLIQLVKAGDQQSFGKLIDKCSNYVYGIALKMLGDADDAHDAAQESFIKIWQKIHTYKSHFKFTTWLYKIVINTCLDRLRDRNRDNTIFQKVDDHTDLTTTTEPKMEFEEQEFIAYIRMISERLSPRQHSVFVLHDLEELGQEEIAKILNMSKGSVKSNLYHARKAIRKILISLDKAKTNAL